MKKPGTLSLVVGAVVLAYGIYNLVAGGGGFFFLGLGMVIFFAGFISRALKSTVFDVSLVVLTVLGVLLTGLHKIVNSGHHEEASHSSSESHPE